MDNQSRHDHMEGRRLPRHAAEYRQCRTVRRERTDQANLSGMDTRRNAEEKAITGCRLQLESQGADHQGMDPDAQNR